MARSTRVLAWEMADMLEKNCQYQRKVDYQIAAELRRLAQVEVEYKMLLKYGKKNTGN